MASKKSNSNQKLPAITTETEQDQKKIQNPHDALFKSLCGNIDVAIDLIKSAVPATLVEKIKFNTLKPTDKSFVTKNLRQYHSDIIYQAEINGHEGYIAFLIEHQSTDDPMMAFRKLEYNIGLMRQHVDQKGKLPVIINICLYHGEKSPYPHSKDLFDCFSDSELARQWMFKPFELIDLTQMTDEQIEHHGYAALMEFLFKHAREAEFSRYAKQLVTFLRRVNADFYLQNVLYYLSEVCGDKDSVHRLLAALRKELPEKESAIMTYGEQLRQEGRQEATERTKAQVLRDVAIGLLKSKTDEAVIRSVTSFSSKELAEIKKEI